MQQQQQTEQGFWKIIKESPNYLVSDQGQVMNIKKRRLMTPTDNGRGYLVVGINKNGKHTKKSIPRLMAEAFLPNPEQLPEVDHRDCDTKNNKLPNLRWANKSQQGANRSGWGLA